MILSGVQQAGKPGYPWLVFLHGFSGDCREWQGVGERLCDYPRLYLDLPGHGGSRNLGVTGFDEMSALLTRTLISYNILLVFLSRRSVSSLRKEVNQRGIPLNTHS